MNPEGTAGWAVQQIAEFLTAVSGCPDTESAILSGLEHGAQAFEAEVAAFIQSGEIVCTVGFGSHDVPREELLMLDGGNTIWDVPGLGRFAVAVGEVPDEPRARMILGRAGDDPFDRDETSLLRSMARVLGLTLTNLRTLEEERVLRASLVERQSLLERLDRIQRSISHRAPLQEVLDSITQGTHELLGEEIVGLRLIDPDDPNQALVVSSSGLAAEMEEAIRRTPLKQGAGGRAILEGRLVVIENYKDYELAVKPLADQQLSCAMAAPVYEDGDIVGSLVVASFDPERRYSATEQEMLLALAEHASLALTDARTLHGLREAERTKDMFLAMVSHELKTPLTVIMGVMQTLRTKMDRVPPSLRDELMHTAYERGKDLQRLIDMLLKGAQAQLAGRRDPSSLAVEVARAVRGFNSSRTITVGDVPDIYLLLDRAALRQIVGLLIENAISHSSPEGRVGVLVEVADGWVNVFVSNPGELPADLAVKQLFEPFQRGPDATSSGVGLGLHVAAKLATSLDGHIDARSEGGEVHFTLTFPLIPCYSEDLMTESATPTK
jgi:signal transduction histidine kinase